MSDDGYHEIAALRAELSRMVRERDQALANLDLTIEALEAIRLHELACDRGTAFSGHKARLALQHVRPVEATA